MHPFQSTIRRMKICMFVWKIEKCTTYMGVDHMHTACLAQRNQDLLVWPYLSELLSALPSRTYLAMATY